MFAQAIAALNTTNNTPWLTPKQIQALQDQILRQPDRTLLEANEAIQKLLFKAQVDPNEQTGEQDPTVKLIDFAHPEKNQFRAAHKIIQQLRSGTTAAERSGVIWHTQGSGKSLTMVFVARLIRAASDSSDISMVMAHKFQQRDPGTPLQVAEALGTYLTIPFCI